MKKILLFVAFSAVAVVSYSAARPFSPKGDVAKYRFTGYWEAVTIVSKTDILSEEAKTALVNLLMDAPEMGQYVVEVENQ